jgi:hypothetical protein
MNPLLQIVQQLLPIFMSAYTRFTTKHPGVAPTLEDLRAELIANGDVILAEGAAWKAANPED